MPRELGAAQRPAETAAEVVWERELPVVSGVVATEDVAVVYTATEEGALTLVGVSTQDGSPLWEHPAGRGAVRPSLSEITPTVFVRDDQVLVAYLEPDPPASSTSLARNSLIIADLETGETVGQTEDLYFSSSPERCSDRPSVCVWAAHDGRFDRAFLDLDTMTLRTHPYQFQDHSGTSGVEAAEHSSGWQLVHATDDGSWTRAVADLPGGSDVTSLSAAIPGDDVDWLAVILRDLSGQGPEATSVALAEDTMMLLDAESGEVVWSGEGYARECPTVYLNAGVRCRASGVKNLDGGDDVYADLDLTLEGFTADGRTTWTLPLGADPGPLTGAGPSAPGDWLVLTTAEGTVLLDPDSGRTMPVPTGWTFLCGQTAEVPTSVHWDIEEPEEDTWSGGTLYSVCTADGTEIDGPPSLAAVHAEGVQSGAVTIVAHPGRLVAYDVADEEDEPTPEPTSSGRSA